MAIHESILDTIGRTPVVRLHRVAPSNVTLYAKVESFNPGGSVKDRLAIAIILDAEAKGLLKPGDTVVEATSGNTGVALAMVCAARGYKFVATMAETFSVERRKLMRAYGAKVILTPAAERGSGMVRKAEELAKKHGWFLARQFENPANPAYHRQTTAAEILRDFAGRRLDHFVTGWGTGGTLTGVGRRLKQHNPAVKIFAAEPEYGELVYGLRNIDEGFIPPVLDQDLLDGRVKVDSLKALIATRDLAAAEGIFA
ncbi:MAG TPA: pyridoxal-phosphate dependent enzyme, partial [Xanthomonadaceae bacterium]|nr:pyridoxal-phosphate dependent enzyme [Xanthomonadaceae bacterium]